jgi:DNA repair protein RadA/Sms
MPKIANIRRCANCGAEVINKPDLMKCPQCGMIGTLEDVTPIEPASAPASLRSAGNKDLTVRRLKQVSIREDNRIKCEIGEVDRVMGGGFVDDSVMILTAPPGQGKSTLLLDIANHLANNGKMVLYISSEESDTQVRGRANRILSSISDNLFILATKETADIRIAVEKLDPAVLIIDSISSFRSAAFPTSPAGSITQVRECSDMIIQLCKGSSRPRIGIVIAHVTKDDEMAGTRAIEHDVDAVAYLEGNSDEDLRILRTTKNRFGELDCGLFTMGEDGLKEIKDPSEYFVTKRDKGDKVYGTALSVVKEGNRAIVVEIESLLSYTYSPYPTRIATCLRKDNLNILISVLERCMSINLSKENAIINTTNHLKLSNTSTDLAIAVSILSSKYKCPLSSEDVFVAEVGLTGELKKVQGLDRRLRELDRLGYKRAFVARGSTEKVGALKTLKVIECKNIREAWEKATGRASEKAEEEAD